MKKLLLCCFLIFYFLTGATAMMQIIDLPELVHTSCVIAKGTVIKVKEYKTEKNIVLAENTVKIDEVIYGSSLKKGEAAIITTAPYFEDNVSLKQGDTAIFFLSKKQDKYYINGGFQGCWYFDEMGFYGFAQLKSLDDIKKAINTPYKNKQ